MSSSDALPDMKRELEFYPARNESPRRLTREQVDHFNERGYLFPLDVMTGEEVALNRGYFGRLMAMAEEEGLNSYSINGWHSSCAGVYDLVVNDRILNPVEDLLGPDLVCTMTHYFNKPPGDAKASKPWASIISANSSTRMANP